MSVKGMTVKLVSLFTALTIICFVHANTVTADLIPPGYHAVDHTIVFVDSLDGQAGSYAALFIPGGHGAMLGLPDDQNVATVLRWAHNNELFTIRLCHGPGAFLATTLGSREFLDCGYEMAVFSYAVDKKTPWVGYLPGQMPSELGAQLEKLGAKIINSKADATCCLDRKLITGASPDAANELGKLAAMTLLEHLNTVESGAAPETP